MAQVEKECKVFDFCLAHIVTEQESAALEQLFETLPKDLLI